MFCTVALENRKLKVEMKELMGKIQPVFPISSYTVAEKNHNRTSKKKKI
jgi:hypothetical protein